jgi:hypothetical protein
MRIAGTPAQGYVEIKDEKHAVMFALTWSWNSTCHQKLLKCSTSVCIEFKQEIMQIGRPWWHGSRLIYKRMGQDLDPGPEQWTGNSSSCTSRML